MTDRWLQLMRRGEPGRAATLGEGIVELAQAAAAVHRYEAMEAGGVTPAERVGPREIPHETEQHTHLSFHEILGREMARAAHEDNASDAPPAPSSGVRPRMRGHSE